MNNLDSVKKNVMSELLKNKPILVIFATYIFIEVCKITGWVCGPPIQRYFELTNTQLGLILSALSLGALVMNMGIGTLTDHIGLWRIWKLGITGSIVAMLLFFFAQGFWTVFIPLFILGLMHVLTLNANNTYLSGEYKENSLHIMALASGLWFGSSVISTPLVGLWVEYADKASLGRLVFLVPYGVGIVLLLLVRVIGGKFAKGVIKKTDHEDRLISAYQPDAHLMVKQNLYQWVSIIIIASCHGTLIVGIVSWANPMVQQRFGVNDFYGSLIFAGFAFGQAAGRFSIASGIVRLNTRVIMAGGGMAGGIILVAGLFAPNYWLTFAAITLGAAAVSVTAPCLLAVVPQEFPAIRTHLYGHIGASICIAAFIAPSIIGILADWGLSINIALLLSPLAALTTGVTSLLWEIKVRKQTAATIKVSA
jgi:MFS family permease